MASISSELAALRAVTFRISSTPTSQLPQQIPTISSALSNCKSLLSSAPASGSKSASETSVAVHKFRTQLSALLQDRSAQGRWSAIVLVKSAIEAGGWETLQKSLPWVRGLLGILTKPDPPSSKKLCIITLVRIFVLTRDYPTLVREITTPSLPTFIQSCLQLANSKSSSHLLHSILESFCILMPRHPTVFRSYIKQLHQVLALILAPTPSNLLGQEQSQRFPFNVPSEVSEAARRLYVQLPSCAPKGASTEEWESSLKKSIANAHSLGDKVFRAVTEDWQPPLGATVTSIRQTLDSQPQELQTDALGLPPWSGLYAGSERLVGILRLIKEYTAAPTTNVISLRFNSIIDLLRRMFSLTVPSAPGSKEFHNTYQFNAQVSKEERENLWAVLPSIHVVTIELLLAMVQRFKDAFAPLAPILLDQLIWVFNTEKAAVDIRTAVYVAIGQLLSIAGSTLPKASIDPLGPIIRTCCSDLLPLHRTTPINPPASQGKLNGTHQPQATTNADSFLTNSETPKPITTPFLGLSNAASTLLPLLLSCLPVQYLSDSIRTRIDRTAILLQHEDAMVASVLNPPPTKKFGKAAASILPLLARTASGSAGVESLLRPRMPVIRTGRREEDEGEEDEKDEIEEEDEEMADEGGHFVGEELDSLLAFDSHERVAREAEPVIDQTPTAVPASLPSIASPPMSSSKRPQAASPPLSPTKRLRIDDHAVQTEVVVASTGLPTTMVVESRTERTVEVSQEPPITNSGVSVGSAGANSSVGAADLDNDSDGEDDFGTLVLGQDTDDEDV